MNDNIEKTNQTIGHIITKLNAISRSKACTKDYREDLLKTNIMLDNIRTELTAQAKQTEHEGTERARHELVPSKLIYKDVAFAGKQIFADIDAEFNMAEYKKLPGEQPVIKPYKFQEHMVGYEPFIQFPPKEWDDMMDNLFKEMVDAWNEKYSLDINTKNA